MPTYDYRCEACQHQFEEMQSMKDEPLKTCPKCNQDQLRRLFGTGAGILFRGSGFYITDYRSESYRSAAKADQERANSSSNGKSESSATGSTGSGGSSSAANPSNSAPNSSKSST
jgi:putative FmdB family regulatory protein